MKLYTVCVKRPKPTGDQPVPALTCVLCLDHLDGLVVSCRRPVREVQDSNPALPSWIMPVTGARSNSVGSVLGSLSCLMLRHGFDPPLSLRLRGFSLGVNMGPESIPQKLFRVRV